MEQRDPEFIQRGGGQREQGLKQCGVQRENRAPAELSAWALNTHDLLSETQDLRRENEDLRLRLHRLETRLVIFGDNSGQKGPRGRPANADHAEDTRAKPRGGHPDTSIKK